MRGGAVLGGLLAALVIAPPAPAAAAPTIDYIYVEANEAGSSGGHAAIRFGDRVFHFQYTGDGLLGVSREDFPSFRRNYALLENRTIRIIPIPVSEETFDLVHGHFARRRIIQHQHLQIVDSLAADRRLLQVFQALGRGESAAPIVVEGAGYFAGSAPDADGAGEPSDAIARLAERIESTQGPEYLDARLAAIRQQAAALDPREIPAPDVAVSADRLPSPAYGFAQRYRDAVAAALALEVIQKGRGLVPGAYLHTRRPELALGDDEVEAVDALAAALTQSLVRLVRSDRPDWGPALLVGLARLDALGKTRQTRSWVFIDVFPPDSRRLGRERLARRPQLVGALLREAQGDFIAAKDRIMRNHRAGGGFRELDFAALEESGNRLVESVRARHDGTELRISRGSQAPARGAALADVTVPPRAAEAAEEQIAAVAAREADYADRLQRLYGYQLLARNCVTEIFHEIDRALAGGPEPGGDDRRAADESRRRLGGHLEMTGLRFIPAVAATAAVETYPIRSTVEIPSHRRASLARLYREEPALRVFLRESNTVTSTLYDRNPEDSYFLFFTDDAVATRPLFGVANVLTGLGAAMAGAITWPVDRGRTLWAGLKGVVYSLPELFFFNIRKGSFDHVADDRRLE